jgi:hypothetical protein
VTLAETVLLIKNNFMKNKSLLLLSCIFLLTFSACKKEGPAGKDGKDGNANVQSATFTVASWNYSSPSYYADINYSAITSGIINSGAVLVYLSNGSGGYSQLPLTIYPSSAYSETFETVTAPGLVRIYITDSDLTAPNTPGTLSFKVVVIAASARIANPDVDLSNYNEVKKAFKLKE